MAEQPFQLKYQFPVPWQGLYCALTSPGKQLESMEQWLRKVRQSRHGNRLSWAELMEFLMREEPMWARGKNSSQSFPVVPVILHFPQSVQTRLMSFLCQHHVEIPKCSLKNLHQMLGKFSEFHSINQAAPNRPCDIRNCGLSISDWTTFWASKFEKFTVCEEGNFRTSQPLNGDSNMDNGKSKLYEFTLENCEAKARILGKILRRGENRKTPEGNPWLCTAWTQHTKQETDTPEFIPSGHHPTLDTSYLPLTQACRQMDGDDVDVSIVSYSPGLRAKRPRLDEWLDIDLSESTLELAVGEKLQTVAQRLRDAWHRSPTDPVRSADLTALTQSSLSELELACSYIDLSNVPEGSLLPVSEAFSGLGEQLPLRHAGVLAEKLLHERVLRLDASGSIPLHQACVALSRVFPSAVVQSVLVPILTSQTLDVHHCDFIDKLTEETPALRAELLGCYLEDRPVMTPAVVPLVHSLTKKQPSLNPVRVTNLIETICGSASALQENLKFGKLVLDAVKLCSGQLTVQEVSNLQQVAAGHKTFLKKSIVAAIKKL